jgi:hypothetical protein
MSGNEEREHVCPNCGSMKVKYDTYGTSYFPALKVFLLETYFYCDCCHKSFCLNMIEHHINNDIIEWNWRMEY